MSREQNLTVGRGLRTTATAAVDPGKSQQSNVPANSLPRLGPAADSRCSKQHERCVNIAEVSNFATYEARPEREARDTRTGV